MARPHKQMPGRTYHINYRGDDFATVECIYLCPYCNQDATACFDVDADAASRAEQGAFFEPVRCDFCGKTTDVSFWKSNKI